MSQAGRHPPFSVVGIGASAGGLEALVELLGALPATGMAFIVVQHLDPTHESLLPEILAKNTSIPVSGAVAGEGLKADHVYVIPPDAILTVRDGLIDLKPRGSTAERPFPVDALFSSLAAAYADCAIGVVLSGADSDGSVGIREIKHAGGFTFAQRPELARFPAMPRHAIETGCVDLALRPSEIAGQLARLSRRVRTADSMSGFGSKHTLDLGPEDESARLAPFFQRLRSAHGVDFTHYKRTTIKRRIERRMMLRRIGSFDEYGELIDRDPDEIESLYQDFLIRVTEFFRDPASFDALRQYVFPALFEGRSAKQPIRIWVPGCATGEEAYSVAIALLEYFSDVQPTPKIQIFGTDVSEAALQKARAGAYPPNALHQVSAERLERFFTTHSDEYRIAKDVRDLCLFAHQDVACDPPFSRLDLISCRNLLIYLDEVAQRRVLRTFHYALRPQGMLFFGPAESVAQSPELFQQVESHLRVFRRMPNTGAEAIAEPGNVSDSRALKPEGSDVPLQVEADSLPREADRLLLARFAPACVLVNQALTILQFRGQTGPYLEPAGGPPSFDLRRVLRPELLVQILPAIGETSKTGVASRRDARLDEREISIEVIPLAGKGGGPSFLILFDDRSRPAWSRSVPAASALTESDKDRRLAHLEREIEGMRDYMRAAIEEHGAVQEELRSAHEEMLSANEEFQSTNEELETSKEELQSTNEELTTTIDELRSRNQELAGVNLELDAARRASDSARSYADIIIETGREPLAVLDGALRILRVNRAFSTSLEVPCEKIEGRFLHEVGDGRWNIPELLERLRALQTDAQPLDDWEVTLDLRQQGRRVVSLSARRIPGDATRDQQLLLALEDVTARADKTAGLLASDERKDQFIAMLGHELRHPLTPITHSIYLLRQGNADPAALELIDTIDTQTQTLLRFVNELLDLSRVSHGLIEIRPERLDFVALVRDAVQALQPFVEERRHVLTLVLPPAPMYVNGDAGRLRQVVTNLVENAAKYTEPGGRITVTLEAHGDDAVLRVRDNGIGIVPGNLERIFEPFTRSHPPLTHPSSGLGIGLSVVRRILELHGGHVMVTSGGVGAGSEFVVSVPVTPADMRDDPGVREPRETAGSGRTQRVRRVMIVDDHEEIRKSVARLVRSWGHEVAAANDSPSALSLAEAFQPDCAVVDLSLPGTNGIDLARCLRQRFPAAQLYLIALTGYAGVDIREGCLAAGFDAHLVKPGDIHLLEKLLGSDRGDSDTTRH
jgi:two-component system, chemotaxis family, CheB/CheR fusion protein